ncbi:MAG: geranylgeranylglyceryl/heptaprenylglyceryl phosphate synthase [Candidatus Bathyarchaeia archaeon]
MVGRVEKHLEEAITRDGAIHLTLIDPENMSPEKAGEVAHKLQQLGSSAIMVGGSTVVSPKELDEVVKSIKRRVTIPTILFPNGIAGISQYADAIFFITLMNSMNPYYITGAQALGAPLVKRYGLEVLPMGYLIVGATPGAVGFVGQVISLPLDKPELASMYALAAQYLGMRFVYLEAGSGSERPIPPELISTVRKSVDVKLIVGGGIGTPEQASEAVKAGADAVVTGTIIEHSSIENAGKIIASIRKRH